jgi:parvulin-like peptidyl-prolyl isomerase
MSRTIPSIFLFFLYNALCIGQPVQAQESLLAKAGNVFIGETEFLERFELLPNRFTNRASRIEESKLLFLYSLVAEKLLAQEAEDRHLDSNSLFRQAMTQVKKNLVRDQLYREQILEKIDVSHAEIQKVIPDALRQLVLSYMYFEDSTEAAFIRKQLKKCKYFKRLQIDTSIAAIRDTATLIWGEAEWPIERAAFQMKKGECSQVVHASTGYYILYVEKETRSTYYASLQPHVLHERVKAKLQLRKEKARLDEYLSTLFLSKIGYSFPRSFKILAKTLTDVWSMKASGSEEMISDSLLDILLDRCRDHLNDSLAMVGNSGWTVENVLNKLRGKRFKIDRNRITGTAAQLNMHLLILVQQELLAEEGLTQHLDERASVKKELDIWRQQMLAKFAETNLQQTVQISDQEIFQYYAKTEPDFQYPKVQIRELHTRDLKTMEEVLQEMQSGISFEGLIRRRSSDESSAQEGGLTEAFPIDTRIPLGVVAWRMKIGERQGPIHIKDEYVYFELVKKEFPQGFTDSAFSSLFQKKTAYARSLKQKKTLDKFIAQSAQERGYSVYADRLKMLRVSAVPMMTYRILGFGGRMFAAPFVTPQVDWLEEENSENVPLP